MRLVGFHSRVGRLETKTEGHLSMVVLHLDSTTV